MRNVQTSESQGFALKLHRVGFEYIVDTISQTLQYLDQFPLQDAHARVSTQGLLTSNETFGVYVN